ncbi:MAG: DUF1206 domain-containing protein [Chloroflexota bacterium]
MQANSLRQQSKRIASQATTSRIMENLMRLGYAVRGLVYGAIGVLALQVAVTGGGTLTDSQGAIVALGKTPLGGLLLYIVLVGLIGYALWGLIRALFDPLHKGSDPKGIAERIGYLASGVSYAFLALATYRLIAGVAAAAHNGAQTAQTQQNTAMLLSTTWGVWIVAAVALMFLGSGLIQIVQGLGPNFERQFQPYALSSTQRQWIDRIGRFGTAARGVVFAMIGAFLFLAAYRHDANEAQGIDGVLTALLHQPYGPWLLGVVALGLIAFGVYSAMSGMWLRFKR